MSIEQALADLTSAVKDNTAAQQATLKALAGASTAAPASTPAAKPTKTAKTAPAAAAPVDPAVSPKAVADSVLALAKVDRAAAEEVLGKFGAQRVSNVKPENFAALLEAVKVKTAELEAAKAAGNDPASLI